MSKKQKQHALKVLEKRYFNNPDAKKRLKKARDEADTAAQIYDLRKQAGLTQKQLAEIVGTTQSVISQIEDADYRGHSLEMLRRIAVALHCRVKVEIIPENNKYAYAN